MFGDREEIPDEAKVLLDKAARITHQAMEIMADRAKKHTVSEGLEEHEVENSMVPVSNLAMGTWSPRLCAFEVMDAGQNEGRRIIALCVQLADGKTVMPVLQVADFDMISRSEYLGDSDINIIIPEDSSGVGWQKTIGDTLAKFKAIHGDD